MRSNKVWALIAMTAIRPIYAISIFFSCVIFSRKQYTDANFLHNCWRFYKFCSIITKKGPNYWYWCIYAGLLWVKIVHMYAFYVCKILVQRYGRVKLLTNFKSAHYHYWVSSIVYFRVSSNFHFSLSIILCLVQKYWYVNKISRGGWSGFGKALVWIHPNYFVYLYSNPNKIQTNHMVGGVVQFWLWKIGLLSSLEVGVKLL